MFSLCVCGLSLFSGFPPHAGLQVALGKGGLDPFGDNSIMSLKNSNGIIDSPGQCV